MANKTGINFYDFNFNIHGKLSVIRSYIFKYGWEPVLIQRILIDSEAILEKIIYLDVFVHFLEQWNVIFGV